MSEILNATCSICGKKYHLCRTCENIKSFQPWRTVCDTLPHYAIYLTLAEYTKTKDKKKAKEELENCDLSDLNNFASDKVKIIKYILKEEKPQNEEVNAKSRKINILKDKNISETQRKNNIE